MTPLEKEILTTEDVARIFGLKPSTVGDYARRGVLPSVKIGRHRRYKRSEIEEWLNHKSERNPYR